MSRHERFIRLAEKISSLSTHDKPTGAVITIGNRALAVGINKVKTHPKQINHHTKSHGHSVHAELSAICNVKFQDLGGATMYVARKIKNGCSANSRPCSPCRILLSEFGIKKVVYTVDSLGWHFSVENI